MRIFQKERNPMSHFDHVCNVIVSCDEGKEFTASQIYELVKATQVSRTTVSSYMSKLKNAGCLEKTETGYVCKDNNLVRNYIKQPILRQVGCVPTNGTSTSANNPTVMEALSSDIPAGLIALKEMTDSLDWLINEHIPTLEAKNRKLNEENSSLYNFINKFTGQLSKAKEIRMATAREEDCKEAIVN